MSLLNKLVFLLLLVGFYSPSFAAVDSFEPVSCDVFSEEGSGDKKDDKEEGDEEPDCE
jgi:hypothetical protein